MLQKIIILPLLFISIYASGEFSVLNVPASLDFKGDDSLSSESVGDVLSASLGHWVSSNNNWGGLFINDPFNVPKSAVAVLVDGTSSFKLNNKPTKTYQLTGNTAEESLNVLATDLEAQNREVVDLDVNKAEDGDEAFAETFADLKIPKIKTPSSFKPELHSADKHFLRKMSYINGLIAKIEETEKLPKLLIVRVSLSSIATAHGEKSQTMIDASGLLASAIENLSAAANKATKGQAFITVIANKSDRSKRAADTPVTPEEGKPIDLASLNLAEYYSPEYPVIFNIILWFMVVFALSLLAICYAIGSMDPGRDSIIYRMTSTRMKKDN